MTKWDKFVFSHVFICTFLGTKLNGVQNTEKRFLTKGLMF